MSKQYFGAIRVASFATFVAGSITFFASPACAQINGFNGGIGFAAFNANGPFTPFYSNNGTTVQLASDTGVSNDPAAGQDNSVFYATKQSIENFTATFTYQATSPLSGSNPGDGLTFILQNDPRGTSAVGNGGGYLGYGNFTTATPAISNSVALALNLYAPYTRGSTLFTSPAFSLGTNTYTPTGTVNLASGDPINVALTYNENAKLFTEKLTDTATSAVYTTFYMADLDSLLGATTAYVGFAAADGNAKSTQTVSNFSFTGSVAPEPNVLALLLGTAPVAGFLYLSRGKIRNNKRSKES